LSRRLHAVAYHGYVRRISIQNLDDGGDFTTAYSQRVVGELDGVRVNVIALPDLKQNKKASGRNKDLADLENLP
jgi:hypothetical protein